jgi:hypothetical protein
MPRTSLVRAVFAALVVVVVIAPAEALGAKPVQRFHDHFTDSFASDICGIAVDVDLRVTDNFFVNADGTFKDTSSVRQTFTNPLNGRSVIVSAAGQVFGGAPVVDEAANTISFDTTYKGLPEKIQSGDGPVLLRDAGIITFRDTFDLTTGDFISEQTIVNNGPHPEADSDFTLFCDVVTSALS